MLVLGMAQAHDPNNLLSEPDMRQIAFTTPSACRAPLRHMVLAAGICLLAACATTATAPEIPANAVAASRMMDNGDEVTEYRVAGQLRAVKVVPKRGPTYYLYDRDGDGRVDRDKDTSPVYFKLFEW